VVVSSLTLYTVGSDSAGTMPLKTIIRVVLSFVLAATIISAAYAQPPPTLVWSDPVNTNDIALSADGQYVVVATSAEVRFYGRSSSAPLWTYSKTGEMFASVAISADGSYVAAGGFHIYFWSNAKSLPHDNPAPTWISVDLNGQIQHRCLAISDDGSTVAACGTGPGVYVFSWTGAAGKSGSDVDMTWDYFLNGQVEAIAISDDGNHVAAVGYGSLPDGGGLGGVLVYWNNAGSLTKTYPPSPLPGQEPTWSGQESGEDFVDVAISDDGNYVAVAGMGGTGTVYYWAGATSRTGTPQPPTWEASEGGVPFTSVDMSCDGDSVIAGAGTLAPIFLAGAGMAVAEAPANGPTSNSVYFWGGARSLTSNPSPSWVYPTVYPVWDVAINDAGTYMAAVDIGLPDTLYFFNRQGNLLWQDQAISGELLSISCDGRTLAVGHYANPQTTAYLFDTGYSSPCCGAEEAVGGAVMPVNILATWGPWLAVIGVAGCIGTAVVVAKKRHL
jgi:hypothetical protein